MPKADKALVARRVEDILRIRLDGAQYWDVREYVREQEAEEGSAWFVGEGNPLSDAQVRRYQQRADALIYESHDSSRKRLFRRHLAQRKALYARAVTTGDIRAALAVLQDEARLTRLYPADAIELRLADLEKQLRQLKSRGPQPPQLPPTEADEAEEDEQCA